MSKSTIPSKRPASEAQEAAWVADEDRFVLQQAKKKAALRAIGRRASPIDWLAVLLLVSDPERNSLDDEVDLEDLDLQTPETLLDKLGDKDLAGLEKGIETFLTLEKTRSNIEYWKTMKAIISDRRAQRTASDQSARGMSSVAGDLDKLLGPKTLPELEKLEQQIHTKLASDEPIDTDYWENLLRTLLTYKAKAKLRAITAKILQARLQSVREERKAGADSADQDDLSKQLAQQTEKVQSSGIIPGRTRLASKSSDQIEPASKRQRTTANGGESTPAQSSSQAAFDRDLMRGLADNEELLTAEESVQTKNMHLWPADVRPRKPRYFARVVTGYEWNKYNQTHYDADNPPPRVIQGYRFNILYPDLADKTRAPTYKIEREGGRRRGELSAPAGEDDTCIIRFIAGAPYEDLAFRIVDKEWDYSAKRERGFRSTFDKGILQLHFQFKKIYYRK